MLLHGGDLARRVVALFAAIEQFGVLRARVTVEVGARLVDFLTIRRTTLETHVVVRARHVLVEALARGERLLDWALATLEAAVAMHGVDVRHQRAFGSVIFAAARKRARVPHTLVYGLHVSPQIAGRGELLVARRAAERAQAPMHRTHVRRQV